MTNIDVLKAVACVHHIIDILYNTYMQVIWILDGICESQCTDVSRLVH